MAFRIAPLRIPNMSTDFGNVGALTANIGQQFLGGMEQGRKQAEETETRALLGEAMKTGDFTKAGQALLARGKIEQGTALLGLGRQAASDANDTAILRSLGLGGAPSQAGVGSGGVSIPRVAAPKQGVHVAETEEDVQRLERATGMVTTDADKEAIVKTVYGEAANQPAVGQQAVAAVIRNRANQAGLTPEQITRERNQFEPWNTEAGRARMNSIPEQRFQQIAGTVAPVIEQGLDPTGGATHFYAPKAQAALGRPAPKWDNGTGNDIADHRFFSLGYGQGGGTPAPAPQAIIASAQGLPEPPAQVAQAAGFLGNEPPPATAFAPQGQPAPSQVAQAPAQPQGAQIPGDDPIRLRQEAAYYERSNPEAARQLRARADAAERQGGVQTAQVAADQPAPGASEAQGFVVPGTGEVVPVETIATNPRLKNLAMAMAAIKDPAKRAGVEKLFQLELEATKERAAAELRSAELEGKRLANDKARRELNGPGVRTLTSPDERAQFGVDPNYKGPVQVDREGKLLFPGKAQTEVNLDQRAETAESKQIGEAAGKRAGETMAAAGSASKQLLRLGQMEALMKNVETGRLQPSRMSVAALGKAVGVDDKYLEALGLDPKGVGDAQALNAISGRMLVDMIGSGGFPANNFSNTDREFLTGTLPSLANDPRANSLLIESAKRMAQIDIEKAKGWREYRRANPKGSFDDFELEFADKIGAQDRFADIAKRASELSSAPAAPAAAPRRGALEDGYRFKGGNPSDPNSWVKVN